MLLYSDWKRKREMTRSSKSKRADRSSMANWSSVPGELVGLISNQLTTIEDHSALASLCRSYRSATKGEDWRPEHVAQPPWLLLCGRDGYEDDDDEDSDNGRRGLLSMYRQSKKFVMDLPELHGGHCWGTPYGWIVTLSRDMKLHLFNPLTRRRTALADLDPEPPSLAFWGPKNARHDFIDRAILFPRSDLGSSSPGFLVVTISRFGELRIMRGETWVDLTFLSGFARIKNIVCYRGQIYAVCNLGELLICSNFDGPGPPTADVFVPINLERFKGFNYERYYVVESSEELLMVVRYLDEHTEDKYYHTELFEVYKLNFETKQWIEIYDLGDNALFVGDCQSISLPQPGNFNCRSNCIYFSDDNYEQFIDKGGQDMGIYDFTQHTSEPFYNGDDSLSTYSTPTWFIPTLT